MQMLADRVWTPEDLDQLPESGERFEVLDGVLLVTAQPARPHQRVSMRLSVLLAVYVEAHVIGETYAPGELRFGQNLLAPDIVVAPIGADAPDDWDSMPRPVLVVEINSPSTQLRDHGMKRLAYLALGVPEYWQIDLDERSLRVARAEQDDLVTTSVYAWQPRADVPPLRIDVAALFR